jgi:predicted O-methyltransferase YrrM
MNHINENIIGWFSFERLYRDMVNKFPSGSIFIEVGTYEGKSLAYLLVEMINAEKQFKVIGVDSFTFLGENGKNILENLYTNLTPVRDKFDTLICQSWDAASQFNDKSVDFVFLDADHVYDSIIKDLRAWVPKIKPGGIIAGHDYCKEHPGVEQAVNEIFGKENVCFEYIDELCWMVKY